MKHSFTTLFALMGILIMFNGTASSADESPRDRRLFDGGWKFFRGEAKGAEQTTFDDSSWRGVNLPHDWSIEPDPNGKGEDFDGIFSKKYNQGSGCLPGGIGWYRKSFDVPADASGKRFFVEFEGVYMNSDVWINGQHLGNRPYGYIGFEYDLTPHLKPGKTNVLAVRANVEQPCSRWFSGAGIYRHVWLTSTSPVHIAHWGVTITTPKIAQDAADVRIRTQVLNQSGGAKAAAARVTILDPESREAAKFESALTFDAQGQANADQVLKVGAPKLWSTATPALYTARVEIVLDGQVADRVDTAFGIRTIEFTKDRGFLLNGQHVPIYGVCDHHDQGSLGAAAYDRAIERQIEILKTMGCNAIRTSHNPPAPKLLEVCDRLGLVVMDEAFDEWKNGKTHNGYGRFYDQWSERDIKDMVRRDRNHPCVVLWSIGNEIHEQGDAVNGPKQAKRLATFVREEDPTRPVTSACNNAGGAVKTGYADALDVLGINYNTGAYGTWKGQRALIGSETSSTVSTRGEYNLVLKDGKVVIEPRLNTHCTAYDLYRPGWAVQTELQFKRLKESPYIAGEFVWTGFDYIGEPTPFPWPAVSSYFGIVDLCGYPKDRFYLYQSQWTTKPMVHVLPSWNWPAEFAGKEIPVWVYSNADTVELFLNGKSLGGKRMSDAQPKKYVIDKGVDRKTKKPHTTEIEIGWYHQEWSVPYQAGTLKAVAKKNGQVVAEDQVITAGSPAKLVLEVDRNQLKADGQDLGYVTASVLDGEGHPCPNADNLIKFAVEGDAVVAAVGNGNPISHEDFLASQRKAFHGLCMAIIRTGTKGGAIKVTATADGLSPASVEMKAQP